MNFKPKRYLAPSLIGAVLVAACGGSSDDGAGQLSTFQAVPDSVELQSSTTACPGPVKAGEFSVIGGAAPYTISSPHHQLVTFSAPGGAAPTHTGSYTVSNRNGQFAVYIEGCFDPAVLTVLDDLKRVVTIEVAYKASGAN